MTEDEVLAGILHKVEDNAMADGIDSFAKGGSLRLISQSLSLGDEEFCVVLRGYINDLRRQLSASAEYGDTVANQLAEVLTEAAPTDEQPHSLKRWGRVWHPEKGPTLAPMADGYWTPWYIAQMSLDRAIAQIVPEPAPTSEPDRVLVHKLADSAMVHPDEIINALTGICWDEEGAADISAALKEGEG